MFLADMAVAGSGGQDQIIKVDGNVLFGLQTVIAEIRQGRLGKANLHP
jgi:hypothetical protein